MTSIRPPPTSTIHIWTGPNLAALRRMQSASVQCVVTSPPYWSLRENAHPEQIGMEATPGAYVARLVEVFREVHRVLRDDGTLWLNLGDVYAGGSKGARKRGRAYYGDAITSGEVGLMPEAPPNRRPLDGLKVKDLIGLPWRVAFALQDAGWYLRTDIVWRKPSPKPESVRDRPTRAHEFVFLLSKRPRYFYDRLAIQEPAVKGADGSRFDKGKTGAAGGARQGAGPRNELHDGRNARDVWTISPDPFKGAHFAVMPSRLAERCILAGTSAAGACPGCGAPWRRQSERTPMRRRASSKGDALRDGDDRTSPGGCMLEAPQARTTGWRPSCRCPAHAPVPCVVLDPFGGAGTVPSVAEFLGRAGAMCELNASYIELVPERRASVFRTLQKARTLRASPKPSRATPADVQPTLFDQVTA